MLKIVITGGNGLIGSRIIELLKDEFQFISLPHSQMDIRDKENVRKVLKKTDFDFFLHLAGYTNVDKAEIEKNLAYEINVQGTKNVFQTTRELRKKFIYISTDFVFSGQDNIAYDENSTPNPIGYYGKTKYEGEKIVENEAMIIRISYPYRQQFDKKRDFFRTIKMLLERKKTLKMINNSLMTPTLIDDIAYGLKYLVNNFSQEVFHLVGTQTISPLEMGKIIARTFNLDSALVQPISYDDYFKGKAKRPQYAEIKSLKNNFYKMHSFEEGLQIIKS